LTRLYRIYISNPLHIDLEDTDLFPIDFIIAFSYLLAFFISPKIKNITDENMLKMYEVSMASAKAKEFRSQNETQKPVSKFVQARNSTYVQYPKITYNISNLDQILDETGNITTLGTYDTWFERTVVRANNTCETDKARDFILSLTGALSDSTHVRFQDHCPINFSTMSVDNITQTNVTNALA